MYKCSRIIGLGTALTLFGGAAAFAADANISINYHGASSSSIQSDKGGTDMQIYQNDTTTLNTIMLSDGVFASGDQPIVIEPEADGDGTTRLEQAKAGDTPVLSIGASTFFTPYLQIYSIPISYTFFNDLRVKTTIPYIKRTIKRNGESFSTNGLGDMSLGVEYRWYNSNKLQLSTSMDMILPTGDNEAVAKKGADRLTVPLGNGAFSMYTVQHATYKINDDLKVFGNAGIRFFTDADYTAFPNVVPVANSTGIKVHEEKGLTFSGMIGSEYKFLKDFAVAGRFSVINIQNGKQSFDGGPKFSSNDSLTAGDFSATIKYRIWNNLAASLTGIVPVFTHYDSNAVNPEDRSWGINFNLTSFF